MNQHVYWIWFAFPAKQTVAQNGIKIPADFSRQNFREVAAEAYQVCNIELVEAVCCQEPHADGRPHLNLLVRAETHHRWLKVSQRLLRHRKVFVSIGQDVTIMFSCAFKEPLYAKSKEMVSFQHRNCSVVVGVFKRK